MVVRTFSPFLVASVLAVSLLSCESSTGPVSGGTAANALQIVFEPTSLLGAGAVVRHNLAGTAVLETRAVNTPATVEFTGLDTNRVSISIIDKYVDGGRTYIVIRSFLDAPAGAWLWKSNTYILSSNRYARFSVSSAPVVSSPSTILALTHSAFIYTTSAPTTGTGIVRYGDETGKVGLLYVLHSRDIAGPGYCNWTLDHTVAAGDTLKATFDTLYAMNSQTVIWNRPATIVAYRALRGPRLYGYTSSFYVDFAAPFTEKTVFAPSGFPASRWMLDISGPGPATGESFAFVRVTSTPDVPSSITIPMGTVAASYDSVNRRFHSISTTGTVDQLRGDWFSPSNLQTVLTWTVVTSGSASSLRMPAISDSLRQALGVDFTTITTRRLWMFDWDNTSGFDEVMAFNNRSDAAFYDLVSQGYQASVQK